MSAIASNARNSFSGLKNPMYGGMGGVARNVASAQPMTSMTQKLNWLLGSMQDRLTQSSVIHSGMAGRNMSPGILPAVRKTSARDYV